MSVVFPLEALGLLSYSADAGSPRIKREAERVASAFKRWLSNSMRQKTNYIIPHPVVSKALLPLMDRRPNLERRSPRPLIVHPPDINNRGKVSSSLLVPVSLCLRKVSSAASATVSPARVIPNSISPDEMNMGSFDAYSNVVNWKRPCLLSQLPPGNLVLYSKNAPTNDPYQGRWISPNPQSISPLEHGCYCGGGGVCNLRTNCIRDVPRECDPHRPSLYGFGDRSHGTVAPLPPYADVLCNDPIGPSCVGKGLSASIAPLDARPPQFVEGGGGVSIFVKSDTNNSKNGGGEALPSVGISSDRYNDNSNDGNAKLNVSAPARFSINAKPFVPRRLLASAVRDGNVGEMR